MKFILAAVTVAGAVILATRNASQQDDDTSQTTDTLDDFLITMTPSTYTAANVSQTTAQRNTAAFLDMIAAAEGTTGPQGYRAMFGYPAPDRIAPNLDDHPRRYFAFTNSKGEALRTSAAGRYQFLVKTWDTLAARLGLPDFGPASQDAAALELIRERGALADVQAGRLNQAVAKVAKIWASLPGAGYSQPERKIAYLTNQYTAAGGTLSA